MRLSHGIIKSISGTPEFASFYKEAQFAVQCWTAQASDHLPPGADFGTLFSKLSILKTQPRTDKANGRSNFMAASDNGGYSGITLNQNDGREEELWMCRSRCRSLIRLTAPPCQLEGIFPGS